MRTKKEICERIDALMKLRRIVLNDFDPDYIEIDLIDTEIRTLRWVLCAVKW